MKIQLLRVLLAAALLPAAAQANDGLMFSVNLSDTEVLSNFDVSQTYQTLSNYLSSATGSKFKLVVGQNATNELQRTRTGYYALVLGPAHVIGSALKHGYEPVAKMPGGNKTVFVASKSSNVTRIDQTRGKRLALPSEDSLSTYLAQGELNAAGIQAKSHFKSMQYSRYQDSALFTLSIGQVDIAAVDEVVANKWLATNPGVIIGQSQTVPALSIAVNNKIPKAQQEKIRAALLSPKGNALAPVLEQLRIKQFEPAKAEDYTYVSTLGYFTPKILPGAKVIGAREAKALMDKGVPLFDTRVEHEYTEGHIKGAVSLPYKEKSAKEVAFNVALDSWDTSKLPADKNAPIILACNGAECWKSYKSAKVAVDKQYMQVYWFRGGYPEWKAEGYPVQ